ncbi:hypothetical protein EG829_10240 [bacterium]|nr:hypothetical protein [bacterium]
MNASEIQDDVFSGKDPARRLIMPVRDMRKPERADAFEDSLFHRLVIAFQSNYFYAGNTPYLPYQRGSLLHLARAAENEENDPAWKEYKAGLSIRTIRDPGFLYAPVNQIEIKASEQKNDYMVTLRNNILNFDHYMINDGSGSWKKLKGDHATLKKKSLRQAKVIMFRGVSKHKHLTNPVRIRFDAPNKGRGGE